LDAGAAGGVEVKRVRRRDVDLDQVWDVDSKTGKGMFSVSHSKNETSKRPIPHSQGARDAVVRRRILIVMGALLTLVCIATSDVGRDIQRSQ